MCWFALFCTLDTSSVEAGHCALRCRAWKDQMWPTGLHTSKTTHPSAGGRAGSLMGWPLMTWVLLVMAVLLGTYCGNSVRQMVGTSAYNVQQSNKVGQGFKPKGNSLCLYELEENLKSQGLILFWFLCGFTFLFPTHYLWQNESLPRPFIFLTPVPEAETQDEVGSVPASASFLFSIGCRLSINYIDIHTITYILEKQIQSMVSTKNDHFTYYGNHDFACYRWFKIWLIVWTDQQFSWMVG